MTNFIIRPYTDTDYPFVKSSWIKNQCGNMPFKMMKHSAYFEYYSPILDKKIKEIKILIACSKEDQDQTFAYIAFENDILHFIYTKGIYRNFQIATELLAESYKSIPFTFYTHLSDDKYFRNITKRHKMVYNPFLFWSENESARS